MSKLNVEELELICIISNFGLASKILNVAKHFGIKGGTVMLGRGASYNRILEFMGLSEVRKEILYMVADKETAYRALEELNNKFEFYKPNHGIAFTTSISQVVGAHSLDINNRMEEGKEVISMLEAITIIVDKGKAEQVIEAASKAGSKGGTIMNARGSGIHETNRLFHMNIEPEKEMIIILSEKDCTDNIVATISKEIKIDEPGNGIIYVQNVNKAYGVNTNL